ncbi:MAG: branched-chain amino acid ABC transporter substrate-binding protein [Mycobacterium sp.]|nr:branched-chain amino acid ABC transporter substrate-binding protein [Mycobacterium sp.]
MGVDRTRSAMAAAAAVALLAVAGCTQSAPTENSATGSAAQDAAPTDLEIVAQMPIDGDGNEVKLAAGAVPVSPAGNGTATCPPLTIAMAGPLTGADAPFGGNVRDGAQLAVDQHNTANPGCQVQLKAFDTEGDPQKATAIAPQIVDDAAIVGLVGPTWSGETKATGSVFDQAGLVALTPAATNVALSEQGWKTFFRGLSSDGVQGPSLANYLKNVAGVKKACVIDDSTDAGVGQADAVRQTLGPITDTACNISVKKGDKDFSAAVTQVKNQSPDVVVYASYYTEAALLLQQLRDAGYTGLFSGPDGLKDPQFVKAAGQAAEGAILSCPCGPAPASFSDEYSKKFGQAPGTYSVEAYDLATILLTGIDSGAVTRDALLEFVRGYSGQGLAREYRWTDTGELTSNMIWIYKVQ